MSSTTQENSDSGVFTRERILTVVLALFTLLALYLCYLLVQPFIAAISFALALAIATHAPFGWLERRIRHRNLAAGVGVLVNAVLIIAPFLLVATILVQQAIESLTALQQGGDYTNWRAALQGQPQLLEAIEWVQQRFDIEKQLRGIAGNLAGRATGFLGASMAVLTQLVITLFVLFFIYRDRQEALQSLRHLVPLSERETDKVFARIASTIQATVNGSLTVAATQSILAGLMYWMLGVSAPVLWAAATFLTALVPVFGTFLVWGPMSLFLGLSGSWVKALILVGWGMLAIGTIDNLLYPYLVGDKLRLHTVPTFFAILGGITAFGPVGLILGPMILAVTLALLDIWWRRTARGQAAEEAVAGRALSGPPGEVMHDQ